MHKSPLPGSGGMSSSSNGGFDYPSTISSGRALISSTAHNNSFASPTESEFSEVFEGPDSVKYVLRQASTLSHMHTDNRFRSWDEKRVVDWLKSINCGQYSDTFKGMLASALQESIR